jgi:hypothetical protein
MGTLRIQEPIDLIHTEMVSPALTEETIEEVILLTMAEAPLNTWISANPLRDREQQLLADTAEDAR